MAWFLFNFVTRQQLAHDFKPVNRQLEEHRMKLRELNGRLLAADTKLDKIQAEILAEIEKLKGQRADVDLPADAEATLGRIEIKAQALDDIVPDAA